VDDALLIHHRGKTNTAGVPAQHVGWMTPFHPPSCRRHAGGPAQPPQACPLCGRPAWTNASPHSPASVLP